MSNSKLIKMKTKRLLTALLCLTAFVLVTNAKTVYCSYNGKDTNNGLSWATAVLSLDTAKVRAAAGDNIWVQGDADGVNGYNSYTRTSTEAGQGKEALSFADLNVFGGFRGDETNLSQRQVIDGDGNGIDTEVEFCLAKLGQCPALGPTQTAHLDAVGAPAKAPSPHAKLAHGWPLGVTARCHLG
jgi:hypothetical protein